MLFVRASTRWKWATPFLSAAVLWTAVSACASRSRFEGLQPQQIHALGQQEFDAGDYDDAIESLDRLLLVFPDYPQIAEARFLLARAYQQDEQYLLASDEYMRFLERHAGHVLAPEAALGVCRSYVALSPIPARDQTYTRQALGVCRDVSREYGTTAAAPEADSLARQMRSKLAEKEYDNARHYYTRDAYESAIQLWELLVTDYADTEWAARALVGIHCSSVKVGYEDDAEDARLRLLNLYPSSPEAEQARNGGLTC